MKREQLSDIIGNLDDRQIAEAYQFDPALCGRSPERIGRMKIKRIVTFALAAVLILALGVTGYAVYRGRVQDLVMKSGKEDIVLVDDGTDIVLPDEDSDIVLVGEAEEQPAAEPQSASYDPLPGDTDMISLQGFAGSPEYQAALAWADFQHNYDRDGSVLASVGNGPTPWTETYSVNGYYVYSQEMADKIDEIAAQYGLTLHSGFLFAGDMAELYARFGQFGKMSNDAGYYFDDGTFQCECSFNGINYQLRRCMKGVLDTVSLNITDAEQYEQWEYTAACGETVLLALGQGKALILAESEQSFVVINILSGTDYGLTVEDVQAMADSINFSIL